MDKKMIVVVAVAAIVVAACIAGFFLLKDKLKSDYSLLDSDDNIVKGLTIDVAFTDVNSNFNDYIRVESTTDTGVTYEFEYAEKTDTKNIVTLESFSPVSALIGFDYTGSSYPQGVTVNVDSNVYTLNGSYEKSMGKYSDKYTFDNLKIKYDGTDVLTVDGKYTQASGPDDHRITITINIGTNDGGITGKSTIKEVGKNTTSKSLFYDQVLGDYEYNASMFTGTTIEKSTGKYGNVDTIQYTINGKVTEGRYAGYTLKDVKLDVYDGFIIHMSGTANNIDVSISMLIFII